MRVFIRAMSFLCINHAAFVFGGRALQCLYFVQTALNSGCGSRILLRLGSVTELERPKASVSESETAPTPITYPDQDCVKGLSLFLSFGVQLDCSADYLLEGRLIDLVAFMQIDCAPCVPIQAGIENAFWVFDGSALRESEL